MNDSSKYSSGSFPLIRMRRNRMKKFSRRIIKENYLNVENLILPLFVAEGKNENTPIHSMPGIFRHSIISLVKEAIEAYKLGIPAIAIFPYIVSSGLAYAPASDGGALAPGILPFWINLVILLL